MNTKYFSTFSLKPFFLLFLSIIFLSSVLPCSVFGLDFKKVLFISSYSQSFSIVPEQIAGVQSVLESKNVHLDIEYMDMKRFDNEENVSLFYQLLKYKLSHTSKYDAVIVADDNALQFAIDNYESLFKDIPVIFIGINDKERELKAIENENFAGISIVGDTLNETIKIANKFYPNAAKVTAIVDNTLTGVGDKNRFYEQAKNFPKLEFNSIDVSEHTFDEMEDILSDIPNDTILLYMSMVRDRYNRIMEINQAVKFINKYSSVPAFRCSSGGLGYGLAGGKMFSYTELGKIAANLVLDILNETPVSSIKIVNANADQYFFDCSILRKFGLDIKIIPKDSIVINKEMSVFEQHKKTIIIALAFMLMLTIFSILLSIDNVKRRSIEKELKNVNEKLFKTYNELTVSEEELRAQFDTIQEQVNHILLLNQKYENSISNIDGAVWEYNLKSEIMCISSEISNITDKLKCTEGYLNDVLGSLFGKSEIDEFKAALSKYLNKESDNINIKLSFKDEDAAKWVLFKGKSVSDSNGNICMLHGLLLDVTKLKEEELYIEYLAEHDYLTNLPNRLQFLNKLEKELNQGSNGSVFLLDIDNFKGINDTLGHTYGDKVLIEISERLKSICDKNLFVSRYGGDEFLILLTGIDDQYTVFEYANSILKLFSESIIIDNRENYISCSMGIANYPSDSKNIEQLLMYADTAMYKVKKDGKNDFMFYFEDLNIELKNKLELEHILRKAVKNHEFELLYQPQINLSTNEVSGFEALIRLKNNHASPLKFIALAEEIGLIVEIGRWVVSEVIKQIAIWNQKGLTGKPIAINFSSSQLRDTGFIDFLNECLIKSDVDPRLIEIEITESILLEKEEKTLEFLNQIRSLGIKLALDDFGTGYSSLSYLTYVPVDKIKLDKSLNDKFLAMDDIKFMDGLISLVHGLNMSIVAEGIETKEPYEILKNMDCDYIQGYLFSKPLKVEDAEKTYYKKFNF